MKSPIDLLVDLWSDNRRLHPGVKGLDRDLITIKSRFEHEGDGFFTIALPSLGKAFLKGLSTGLFACPEGFEKIPKGSIPAFLQGMMCKVFEPVSGNLLDEPDLGIVKSIYEILFMFKKYPSSPKSASLLDQKAKKGFIMNDEECAVYEPHSYLEYMITRVRPYILSSLRGETHEMDMEFRHGPGSVQEGLKPNQKWSAVCRDLFDESFDTSMFALSDFATYMYSVAACGKAASISPCSVPASSSISRLISVPKNSTSRRTITVEPTLKQFLQQGLNSKLRLGIERCSVLSESLDLSDQSINQKLALIGSQTDEWATIDLKSASDLISLKLVKSVFGSLPYFLEAMMVSRSSHYTVEGETPPTIRVMEKYAGMGNATCFPVMSITIALIGICAILDASRLSVTRENIEHAARQIRVFGDDIIVRREFADQVCAWLSFGGLQVNREKSYLVGNFKESCGCDAFRGVEITPLYYRAEPSTSTTDASNCAHLVAFSNQAWLRGLYSLSDAIKQDVERGLSEELPLVHTSSGVLGWHTRLGYSQIHRWNGSLHRFEVKALQVKSRKRSDPLDGWPALLKFYCTSLLERTTGHLGQSTVRFRSRIVRRWVSAS